MGFLLVLPILICGFIYCRTNFYDRTLISRFEGQTLYLHIAMRGIFIVLPTLIVSFLIEYLTDGFFGLSGFLAKRGITSEQDKDLFSTIMFCVISSPFLAYYCAKSNFKITKLRYKLKSDTLTKVFILETMLPLSAHQLLLLRSFSDKQLYMFSMEDRKVYIGCVASIGSLQNQESYFDEGFSIIPILSGYRDKDNLTVEFTTLYEKVFDEIQSKRLDAAGLLDGTEDAEIRQAEKIDEMANLFSITLLQKNIVSMTQFETDIWHQFKKNEVIITKGEATA
ncbi:hypothetical protein NLO88_16560 [Pseudomonas syringae]|nr:hypothetical protein [Pseudomonas syringae]MDG6403790.1 hypothetical protein [Pseudomonas quasicaspiana]